MRAHLALALCTLSTMPLHAACDIAPAAVEARIAKLEPAYGFALSDIACDLPTLSAHQIMCNAAEQPDNPLWRMGRLNDLAWVYAAENATGQQVDLENPPLDSGFIATRDACTNTACLCTVLIDHTNASLGGTWPYLQ